MQHVTPFVPPTTRRQALRLAGAWALAPAAAALAGADSDVWRLLRAGGLAVLLRHAQTDPGLGDPPGFRPHQCATQRNLSAAGRAQARRIGEAFREQRIAVAAVRSSAWCRCIDTARLAFGRVEPWPALDSFFAGQGDAAAQSRAVRRGLTGLRPPANWVLVTHQVNITALTGETPAMGELLLVRPAPAQHAHWPVLARWAA